jgi:hypothetical protein
MAIPPSPKGEFAPSPKKGVYEHSDLVEEIKEKIVEQSAGS